MPEPLTTEPGPSDAWFNCSTTGSGSGEGTQITHEVSNVPAPNATHMTQLERSLG